jgi:hypothetical protein
MFSLNIHSKCFFAQLATIFFLFILYATGVKVCLLLTMFPYILSVHNKFFNAIHNIVRHGVEGAYIFCTFFP